MESTPGQDRFCEKIVNTTCQEQTGNQTGNFFKKRVAFFRKCGRIIHGGIAQLGEHMHHTHGVAGSSPVVSIFSAVLSGREFYIGI